MRPRKGAGLSKDHAGVWGRTKTGILGSCLSPELFPQIPKRLSIT